ncbi:MAG: hypothetical protein CL573_01650 [Alphaproteobacteria bacterium]|nr:hypothetical protein [Alphaproteobacteria bacterium]HCP00065.1 hypothetical protein [Rhodospirillaceae bacterium]|tara:strand:+ start:168 stop:452 length:285 start_codon:yes stop_codon:yes gene_type:complete
MLELYRTVMDSDRNPLNALPRAQRFQIMVVLSMMWTCVFCSAAGLWFWYGELIFIHVLGALGIAMTGLTFHSSSKREPSLNGSGAIGSAQNSDF